MRRAAGCITVGALLTLAGCRSEAPTAPALVVPAEGLRCELLLPPELRDALLPGAQLTQERPCPTCGPVCSLRVQGPPQALASVAYDCRARVGTDYLQLLQPTLRAGGEEVPALGRAAARTSPAPGMLQVVSFDDDTPCSLVVTWLGTGAERAVDLARVALQAATHDSVLGIAPPPPLQFLEDDAGAPPLPTAPAPSPTAPGASSPPAAPAASPSAAPPAPGPAAPPQPAPAAPASPSPAGAAPALPDAGTGA
jgi:hypothetical protein